MKTNRVPARKPGPRALTFLASATFGLITTINPTLAQTYDPTAEFSVTNGNPNGAWSYGWMPVGFVGSFMLLTNHTLPPEVPIWRGWNFDGTPGIWKNTTTAPVNQVPTNMLSLHPGPGTEPAMLRWTAPAAGDVIVQGQFLAGDFGTMQVAIRLAGQNWWQAVDTGAFDLRTNVIADTTIDFTVSGGYAYGNTPLDAVITLTPRVPPLQLVSRIGATNTLLFTPQAAGTNAYVLQYATTLTPPIPWLDVNAFTAPANFPTNFMDARTDPAGFYHVMQIATNAP